MDNYKPKFYKNHSNLIFNYNIDEMSTTAKSITNDISNRPTANYRLNNLPNRVMKSNSITGDNSYNFRSSATSTQETFAKSVTGTFNKPNILKESSGILGQKYDINLDFKTINRLGIDTTPYLDKDLAGKINTLRESPFRLKREKANNLIRDSFPNQLRGIYNLSTSDQKKMKAAFERDIILDKQAGNLPNPVSGIADNNLFNGGRSLKYNYGMGWKNLWTASSKEVGTHYLRNGLRGTISLGMEGLGRISTRDRLMLKANPSIMNKLTAGAVPLTAAATIGYSMYTMDDPSQVITSQLATVGFLTGANAGMYLGAQLTPAKFAWGIARGIGIVGGVALGGIIGGGIVMGVAGTLSDATSNESSLRNFALQAAKKEVFTSSQDTRQSLTARQMAINKLARSGMNDRSLLLANEAVALKGLI